MANNEVKLIISADGSGAIQVLRSVQDGMQKMETETASFTSKVKAHWMGLSAAAIAVYGAISKASEYMQLSAKASQAEASFRTITASFNVNADSMRNKMKEVSRGMIDDSDLMQKATQGFMLGLDDKKIVALLDASRNAAKVWGQDVGTTFDTLVTSVGGGVRAMGPLVQMGLVTKEEYKLLNKVMEEGAADMDVYTLVQARAALQAARFGNEALNALERSQKFHAEIKELKETIGKGLITSLQYAYGGFQWLAAGMLTAYAGIEKLLGGYSSLMQKEAEFFKDKKNAREWGAKSKEFEGRGDAALAAARELTSKAMEKWGGGVSTTDADRAAKIAAAKRVVEDFDAKLKALANRGKESELAQAMTEWEKRVALLNPLLSETDRKLITINEEAQKLREKFGSNARIEKGLQQGIAFINEEQLLKARTGLHAYVQDVIAARDAAVKKEAEAEEWLKERIGEYTVSETDFREQKLLEEFSKRAEILGWTEQLYKTFQAGLSQIDSEARQRTMSAEANYQRNLVDTYEKLYSIDPTTAAQRRVEITQREITAQRTLLATDRPDQYIDRLRTIDELYLRLAGETDVLKQQTGTFWDGMNDAAKRYGITQLSDYQEGMEVFSTVTSSMQSHMSDFFDYQSKGWMNWRKLAGDMIHDVYMELMRLYVIKPLIGSATNGLASLFGGGSTGSNFSLGQAEDISNLPEELSAGASFHRGGNVTAYIPRRHFGGLRENERLTINKVNERYITEEQNAWLTGIAKKMDSGAQKAGPTIINHITIQATDVGSFRAQAWRIKEDFAAMIGSMMKDNHPIRRTR